MADSPFYTSLLDSDLWNAAQWSGVVYAIEEPHGPPLFALQFANSDAGKKLMLKLLDEVGPVDREEFIYVSVIENDVASDGSYSVYIGPNPTVVADWLRNSSQPLPEKMLLAGRRIECKGHMLQAFKAAYAKEGRFLLTFAIPCEDGSAGGVFEMTFPSRSARSTSRSRVHSPVLRWSTELPRKVRRKNRSRNCWIV